jgi:hypothetical protein
MPAMAEDMFEDLVQTSTSRTISNRTPSDILDEIEEILTAIYDSQGNRYHIKTTAGTGDDNEFKAMYENANGNLKALWKEFHVALKSDMNASALAKDKDFQRAADQAMEAYRKNFGGDEAQLLTEYSRIKNLVNTHNYTLRYNKSWFDKFEKMSSSVLYAPSEDPTQWDSNEVVYLIGLLPSELRNDMNMTIKTAYLYGYMNQAAVRGFSASSLSHYSSLRPSELSWDTYIDDGYYYEHIYNSSYLSNDLTTTFKGMSTRSGNTDRYIQNCQKALEAMKNAKERADKFKEQNNLGRDSKGRMEFKGGKSDWENVAASYRDICADMENAMREFKTSWANFVKAFPGDATGEFQQALNKAFSNYYNDFEYAPMDSLDSRYQSLKAKSGQFKLERVTDSFWTGATDQSLYVPSSWAKPRKALYSAQKVISYLPPDMRTVHDNRRQRAYRNGASAAEADYQRELRRIEAENAANSSNSDWNDGSDWDNNSGSDWNDNNSGSDWNNNNNNNNSGSDWNNNNSNNNSGSDWNNSSSSSSNSGSDWNNSSSSSSNSGSDWNNSSSSNSTSNSGSDSNNGWGDEGTSSNNGW